MRLFHTFSHVHKIGMWKIVKEHATSFLLVASYFCYFCPSSASRCRCDSCVLSFFLFRNVKVLIAIKCYNQHPGGVWNDVAVLWNIIVFKNEPFRSAYSLLCRSYQYQLNFINGISRWTWCMCDICVYCIMCASWWFNLFGLGHFVHFRDDVFDWFID